MKIRKLLINPNKADFSATELKRVVDFFSILIEIDQRVKKEEAIKNETKIN